MGKVTEAMEKRRRKLGLWLQSPHPDLSKDLKQQKLLAKTSGDQVTIEQYWEGRTDPAPYSTVNHPDGL